MGKKDLKKLAEAYKRVVKEDFFDSYDHEERDDSWYHEDGAQTQNQVAQSREIPPEQVKSYNQAMAPQHFADKPFNAYECCNKIILSCEDRLEVVEMFCKLIDHLASSCEDNPALIKDFVSRLG